MRFRVPLLLWVFMLFISLGAVRVGAEEPSDQTPEYLAQKYNIDEQVGETVALMLLVRKKVPVGLQNDITDMAREIVLTAQAVRSLSHDLARFKEAGGADMDERLRLRSRMDMLKQALKDTSTKVADLNYSLLVH